MLGAKNPTCFHSDFMKCPLSESFRCAVRSFSKLNTYRHYEKQPFLFHKYPSKINCFFYVLGGRDRNKELILVENWFPVVQFLGIVSQSFRLGSTFCCNQLIWVWVPEEKNSGVVYNITFIFLFFANCIQDRNICINITALCKHLCRQQC